MIKLRGGASDSRLIAVVTNRPAETGQFFRSPIAADEKAVRAAKSELKRRAEKCKDDRPLIPDGHINHLRGFFNIVLYGITEWGDIFSPRQILTLSTFARLVRELPANNEQNRKDGLTEALKTIMALVVDRVAVRCTSNCIWDATTGCIMQVFNQGQALPARWEFAEMSPCIDSGSGWATSVGYSLKVLDHVASISHTGHSERASAMEHPLPTDAAQAIITDPPYYAAIPYADLSDFFFSWLKRSLAGLHEDLLRPQLTEKKDELVALSHRAAMYREKDNQWFEQKMGLACSEARRVCEPSGLGVFVFANKETQAWEAMLAALVNAGWIVTASWPIDTESGNRLRAKASAALASSIHLVCRPREKVEQASCLLNPTLMPTSPEPALGQLKEPTKQDSISDFSSQDACSTGDWRDVLAEEGVVGADAIFACLGPALEIFSRYSRVEKASGEAVTLKEYLEQVWAVVAKEALTMIFSGADATGFEEDARLTAMWLWTLNTNAEGEKLKAEGEAEDSEEDGVENAKGGKAKGGFMLEFDAARKIAQGLGAHLEDLTTLVEVSGETARLLPVAERSAYLIGRDVSKLATTKTRKSRGQQTEMGQIIREADVASGRDPDADATPIEGRIDKHGQTVLDRVHQSMILFAASRGEALKRFLVEDGAGNDQRFWRLAQALSALYPISTDEKRWVDGVLARKKGLGF